MTYTSVKKFTLSEEDKEAIRRTHNIIKQIYEKMDNDEWFESNIYAINKEDMKSTESYLRTFLETATYNDNIIIEREQI